MGNGIAYAVLALWPLIAIHLYRVKSIQIASLWTILGGFMFLPVKTSVDLPMIPAMGKHSIPTVSALIGCWLIRKKGVSYFKELGNIKYLVILFLILPFVTASQNGDSMTIGGLYIPRMSYYDGLSSLINQFLFVSPYFIARQFFRTYEDQVALFKVMVWAGLCYSLLILFEVRMSPSLHLWLYGYFPHNFGQQMRGGGFRAVVFMGHGLWVAFFTMVIVVAATALWKNKIKVRQFSSSTAAKYMLFVLVLCKSIASLMYGVFGMVMILFTKPKLQQRAAILLVVIALLYPAMTIMKIFPHQTLLNAATSISADRAQSLQFRFDNEEVLLTHARERFYFGWGGWGRNRVYSHETGEDITVTDGRWIITLGQFGIFGFITEFMFLAITVFRARTAAKLLSSKPEQVMLSAHMLIVAILIIDQLPNASLAPWLWFVAGALLGRSEEIIAKNKFTTPAVNPVS